jgi:hypothetical protein
MITLRLMTQARVREGLREQKRVPEFIADAFFERGHCLVILSEIEKSLNSVKRLRNCLARIRLRGNRS